jgi:two-component system, OmpR family, response regulator
MRILVVEDDPELGPHLADALRRDAYQVELSTDGGEALARGSDDDFDAVVLDLGVPTVDGLSVLKRWRAERRDMPVLVLTARSRWGDKIAGFEAGADDYVTKPFQVEEVLVRLRAILRRTAGGSKTVLRWNDVALDTQSHRVTCAGELVRLSGQEYKILSYLMRNMGRTVSRSELAEHIYDHAYDKDSNLIEVFIGRLRKKLSSDLITTVRGQGYVVAHPSDRGAAGAS